MTLLRKTLAAAVAATIGVTSIVASSTSAHAWKRMSWNELPQRVPMHRNHRGFGFGGLATGLAIGAGIAIIGQAVAEQARKQQHRMSRQEFNTRIRKLRDERLTGHVKQMTRDCAYLGKLVEMTRDDPFKAEVFKEEIQRANRDCARGIPAY
jgi:hypothetical protein